MTTRYKHTQVGYLTLVLAGGAALLIAVLMIAYGFNWLPFIVLICVVIALGLFATLTVEMSQGALEIRFGPGIIRKRFPIEDIESCRVVRNPWYYGWGIRLIPHGWLYNVSGTLAVELQMKSGKRYRIGTDAPEELVKVLQQSLGRRRRNDEHAPSS